jgi:Ca2+-transporting ATPase
MNTNEQLSQVNPHVIESSRIIELLETDRQRGLSGEEAEERISSHGLNKLEGGKKTSAWKILLKNMHNLIVYLLMIASASAFIMGDVVEGVAVIVAILIAVVSGFVTEFKAQKSVESLQKMIKTTAKVKRNGELQRIDSSRLTIGDLLFLEEGDSVTADARIIETSHFAVIESALTGESEAVDKSADSIAQEDTPLGDRTNMVFTGTAVTRGNAYAVVTAVGMKTEMGKISSLLSEQEEQRTPLEKQLDRLGKALILFAAAVAAIVTIFGILSGENVYEMITIGVILAIAAIPEALPAVSTITLAIGMRTMARHNALVKSLPAVETLGSTTVICTDKTGTLTENQMTVRQIFDREGNRYQVTGSGYEPEGAFESSGKQINPQENRDMMELLQAGVLSSNASLFLKDELWQVVGDPTEGGIVAAGRKADLDRESLEEGGLQRLGEIPFNSADKFMATLYTEDGNQTIYIKGAPDVLFSLAGLDQKSADLWRERNDILASEGLRVLAAGRKSGYSGDPDEQTMRNSLSNGFELLGLFGIIDPPRADVKDAIQEAQDAGIRIIMITGDHPKTASFIASQIGISGSDRYLTGRQMDKMSDEELAEAIRDISVFARVSPENKLQIVRALNIDQEVTAMTGDGVNDAPALQGADIGVAMGIRGTEVAKEASDMILTDDRFPTIVDAVREGRAIFDNIEKFVFFLFSCNVVEIIMIFFAIAFNLPLPILALQILYLNLVVDILPAMSFAWEPGEAGIMRRSPRDPQKGIVNRKFLLNILLSGALIGFGSLGVFWYGLNQGYSVELARTVGFTTLAVGQLLHVFNVRKTEKFGLDRSLLENPLVLIALGTSLALQAAAIYLPFLQSVMETRALSGFHWLLVAAGAIVPTVLIQTIWAIGRRLRSSRG